jgi:hypothetical protein
VEESFALLRRTHSWRSAVSGSTVGTRRAGSKHAGNDTTSNKTVVTTNVGKSFGRTPYKRLEYAVTLCAMKQTKEPQQPAAWLSNVHHGSCKET